MPTAGTRVVYIRGVGFRHVGSHSCGQGASGPKNASFATGGVSNVKEAEFLLGDGKGDANIGGLGGKGSKEAEAFRAVVGGTGLEREINLWQSGLAYPHEVAHLKALGLIQPKFMNCKGWEVSPLGKYIDGGVPQTRKQLHDYYIKQRVQQLLRTMSRDQAWATAGAELAYIYHIAGMDPYSIDEAANLTPEAWALIKATLGSGATPQELVARAQYEAEIQRIAKEAETFVSQMTLNLGVVFAQQTSGRNYFVDITRANPRLIKTLVGIGQTADFALMVISLTQVARSAIAVAELADDARTVSTGLAVTRKAITDDAGEILRYQDEAGELIGYNAKGLPVDPNNPFYTTGAPFFAPGTQQYANTPLGKFLNVIVESLDVPEPITFNSLGNQAGDLITAERIVDKAYKLQALDRVKQMRGLLEQANETMGVLARPNTPANPRLTALANAIVTGDTEAALGAVADLTPHEYRVMRGFIGADGGDLTAAHDAGESVLAISRTLKSRNIKTVGIALYGQEPAEVILEAIGGLSPAEFKTIAKFIR